MEKYSGYWLFRVAEFLDPRTYGTLSLVDRVDVLKLVEPLTTYQERTSPSQMDRVRQSSNKRKRKDVPLTEEEQLMQAAGIEVIKKTSLLQDEYAGLVVDLKNAFATKMDPLQFWSVVQGRYPIWARIAARILPTMAASTDVERFFKVMKGVCTDNRASLSPKMVGVLACLLTWLVEEFEYADRKQSNRDKVSKRFTSINSDLELKCPTTLSECDSSSENSESDEN